MKSGKQLRRWIAWIAVFVIAAITVADRYVLPKLVAYEVRKALRKQGIAEPTFDVDSIDLDRVVLRHVDLGKGIVLDEVDLEPGLALLWCGHPERLTIHGGDVPVVALARWIAHAPVAAHATQLRIVETTLSIGDAKLRANGAIAWSSTAPLSIELTATADRWQRGAIAVRDVVATVRDAAGAHDAHDAQLEVCIAGRVGGDSDASPVHACTTLPRSMHALADVHALDVTWDAGAAPSWTARGHATLARGTTGEIAIEHGDATLAIPASVGGAAKSSGPTGSIDVAARFAGTASDLAIDGDASSEALDVHATPSSTATLHQAHLPFALHARVVDGAFVVMPRTPLVATAATATIRHGDTRVDVARVVITLRDRDAAAFVVGNSPTVWPRALAWHAASARWGDVSLARVAGTLELAARDRPARETIAWTAMAGPGPLRFGGGHVELRFAGDRVWLDGAALHAIGGALTIDPCVAIPRRPLALVIHARDLALGELLRAAGRGHVSGSGVIDGDLALQLDAHGVTMTSVALAARGAGNLQLADDAWRRRIAAAATGVAVHQRVLGALADFRYSQLAVALADHGPDPALHVVLRGRGNLVAQDLDLTINLRGVGSVARRVLARRSHQGRP